MSYLGLYWEWLRNLHLIFVFLMLLGIYLIFLGISLAGLGSTLRHKN